MKLSEYAKLHNICYKTAYRRWKRGWLSGQQLAGGTIVLNVGGEDGAAKSAEKVMWDEKGQIKKEIGK